jgi:hypothetical protein
VEVVDTMKNGGFLAMASLVIYDNCNIQELAKIAC